MEGGKTKARKQQQQQRGITRLVKNNLGERHRGAQTTLGLSWGDDGDQVVIGGLRPRAFWRAILIVHVFLGNCPPVVDHVGFSKCHVSLTLVSEFRKIQHKSRFPQSFAFWSDSALRNLFVRSICPPKSP